MANRADKRLEEVVDELIDYGSELTGTATAAIAINLFQANPALAVTLGGAGVALTHILRVTAKEVKERLLGKREELRIGATYIFAADKINRNIENGRQIRQDGFFQEQSNARAQAEEILEGVLLTAQREHQEKKIRFYGNLYANIAFDPTVDRSHANYLIRLLDRLSFRQLCWIAQIQSGYSFTYIQDVPEQADIINELNELAAMGIIKMEMQEGGKFADYSDRLYGARVYDLFGLEDIEKGELQALFRD